MTIAYSESKYFKKALENDHSIILNIVLAGEHVQEIERCIQTVKERIRAQWSRLPCREKILRLITAEPVKQIVAWLNSFPPQRGTSGTSSPRVIMTGIKIDCKKTLQNSIWRSCAGA